MKNYKNTRVFSGMVLWMFFLWCPAIAQNSGKTALDNYVKQFSTNAELTGAGIGVYVMDASTGKEWYSYNAQTGLVTASTMKAITTATALLELGADHTFKTAVGISGYIDSSGTLHGDLVIKGEGDPTLGSEKFTATAPEKFLEKVKSWCVLAGIKSITGNVLADGSSHETAMAVATWQWMDIGNYFGGGPWGLNWRDNMYYLYFNTGPNPGDSTQISHTVPIYTGLEFINEIKSGPKGSGDEGYIYGSEYSYLRFARGTLPPGKSAFSIKGSLPDPGLTLAKEMKDKLTGAGITVTGEALTSRTYLTAIDSVIGTWESPKLSEILKQTNVYSNNLFAEALHKYLGWKKYGLGSNENGNLAIMEYWKNQGIGPGGFVVADGSGLSRCNAISAKNMAMVMYKTSLDTKAPSFIASLPVAGGTGTLKNVGKETTLENNLTAKSGSMDKVRSYTGYITTPSGNKVVFAFIFNNFLSSSRGIKTIMEDLLLKIASVDVE